MFPLRDNIPSSRYPIVTTVLIGVNLIVFVWELMLGWNLDEVWARYSIIPLRYTCLEVARLHTPGQLLVPFFSAMFLHGDWLHLIGNMWILWIFGDNVEDRLGHFRFLLLFLLGGIFASLIHIVTNPSLGVPTIGASGAVSAVMGAYFRFYPLAMVETIIPPFFLGPTIMIPAVVYLGVWFVIQFFNGVLSLTGAGNFGGVAWWAHIGGFIFGLFIGKKLCRRWKKVVYL